MPNPVAEMRVMPLQSILNLLRIRVEQKFVVIKTHSLCSFVGPPHPKTIKRSGSSFGKITVPDQVRLLAHGDAVDFPAATLVKQAQRYGFCVLGKKREVHTFAVPCGAERIGPSRPDNQIRRFRQWPSGENVIDQPRHVRCISGCQKWR